MPNYWKYSFYFAKKIKDGKAGWQTVGDAHIERYTKLEKTGRDLLKASH
jgi:hypothetical protein